MDGFVSSGSQDGGSEDLFGFRIDDDFHEALGFTFFDGAGDV